MEKAILSRINLQLQDTHIAQEYFDTISDLIDTQEVQALKKCSQHMATSRFQHSLNVSYYSWYIVIAPSNWSSTIYFSFLSTFDNRG